MIWEFVGLAEYDPDGRKARILERAIGIKVIRHNSSQNGTGCMLYPPKLEFF